MRGRQGEERKEGIKDEEVGRGGRDRKEKCGLASISIYMFHEDESKRDMDVIPRQLRGHFKLTYQEGWSSV